MFNDNDPTIYSNADKLVGGHFYVCSKETNKCKFFHMETAENFESPEYSNEIIAGDIDDVVLEINTTCNDDDDENEEDENEGDENKEDENKEDENKEDENKEDENEKDENEEDENE
jgi:hypothetical protein